jgi:hypothetical protein
MTRAAMVAVVPFGPGLAQQGGRKRAHETVGCLRDAPCWCTCNGGVRHPPRDCAAHEEKTITIPQTYTLERESGELFVLPEKGSELASDIFDLKTDAHLFVRVTSA